jgi:hypothetical protein
MVRDRREKDHAIPVHIICDRILGAAKLNRKKVETILWEWLVWVELTPSEHRERLKKVGLVKKMPEDWDGVDPSARYRAAGIRLVLFSSGITVTAHPSCP